MAACQAALSCSSSQSSDFNSTTDSHAFSFVKLSTREVLGGPPAAGGATILGGAFGLDFLVTVPGSGVLIPAAFLASSIASVAVLSAFLTGALAGAAGLALAFNSAAYLA